jgi:hypothetical protein
MFDVGFNELPGHILCYLHRLGYRSPLLQSLQRITGSQIHPFIKLFDLQ